MADDCGIREKILELCAEDHYGSWELWWAINAMGGLKVDEPLAQEFSRTISLLIGERKLSCYRQGIDGRSFFATAFSPEKLLSEVKCARSPSPSESYWFYRS